MNITAFKINPKTNEISFSVINNGKKQTSNNNDCSAFQEQLRILQDEMKEFTGSHCTLRSFAIGEKTVKNANNEKIRVKVITTIFEEKRTSPAGKDYFAVTTFEKEMISEMEEVENANILSVKQNVSVAVLNTELVFVEIIEANLGAFFPTKTVSFCRI